MEIRRLFSFGAAAILPVLTRMRPANHPYGNSRMTTIDKGRAGIGMAVLCLGLLPVLLPAGQAAAAGQCGKASWYGLTGMTASGERANPGGLTAAHPFLPFGTMIKVENLKNGRSVMVRINDRGPFSKGRIVDVTRGAAERLGFIRSGIARVRISVPKKAGMLRNNC